MIFWLHQQKEKICATQQGRKLKGADVYIIEHLTKKNTHIKKAKQDPGDLDHTLQHIH